MRETVVGDLLLNQLRQQKNTGPAIVFSLVGTGAGAVAELLRRQESQTPCGHCCT